MASTARLDELKKKFDENPRRYFAPLANEHRKSGDLDEAISLCRAHLPQQPAHISGHIVLGQALFEAGQSGESCAVFQTALELDPENLIALRYLGDIARHAGDVPTARSWYTRVLEVDPRNDEIAQLVRELDAPQASAPPAEEPHAASPAAGSNAATEPARAPGVAAPEPVAAPASSPAENARFAPLEQIDVDADMMSLAGEPMAEAPPNSSAQAQEAVAADEDWDATSPTVDLPMLDIPGIDAFAMPASASAESLVEADHASDEEDALIRDLSGSAPLADVDDFASHPSGDDVWAPVPDDAGTAVEAATLDPVGADAPLEDASFDLEASEPGAAAAEPLSHAAIAGEQNAAPSADAAAIDAEPMHFEVESGDAASPPADSEWGTTVGDEPAAPEAWAFDASPMESDPEAGSEPDDTADAMDAAEQTAAFEPVASDTSAADGLGLEVMEFVPPGARVDAAPVAASSDSDPLLGRTPELTAAAESAPPSVFVTETMAELYLQQGFRNEALSVYRELLARNPGDGSLRDRIEQIESGSMSSIGMAALSENVVESALKRQSTPPARSVRSFFAVLASRRAPGRAATVDAAADEQPAEPLASGTAAAEMAAFDPFAAEPATGHDGRDDEAAPNVSGAPALEPAAEHQAPRSLEEPFSNGAAATRAESATETFATAFARGEPRGRPTRAASNELSLDNVFRGAPEGAASSDGGFSFDQFFSDTRPVGSDVSTAPAAPRPGRGGDGSDAHDIEQFTAWLEGLKKK